MVRERRSIAVAIDKDKGSQHALRWAVDHIVSRDDQIVNLVHVLQRSPTTNFPPDNEALTEQQPDNQISGLFLPFRCLCTRRQIESEVVVLEDPDIAKALIEYIAQNGVGTLVLGTSSRNGLSRLFKNSDIPVNVLKWAPDFCNIYVISKGKINAVRSASRPVPAAISQSQSQSQHGLNVEPATVLSLTRGSDRLYDELPALEPDHSFISTERPSTDSSFFSFYENLGSGLTRDSSRHSTADIINPNFDKLGSEFKSPFDLHYFPDLSQDTARTSCTAPNLEDMEDDMRRLKIELKQTMDMYHAACKEALAAKQKAMELEQWKMREEKRIEEARLAEKRVSETVEREKAKCKEAIEEAEAAHNKRMEVEVQKRVNAEINAFKEAEEKKMVLYALGQSSLALKYQSLFHILAVLFLFYVYFSLFS